MDFSRSLWDSTYVEPSWLTNSKLGGESNIILHRLQKSIDNYLPSVEIMIGEYDFGHDTDVAHGLSIADYLGVAAQYGLSVSNRWDLNAYNGQTYTNSAYKLFTNYDGSKSSYGGKAVFSSFNNRGDGSVWASLNQDDSQLHLIVINKDVSDNLSFSVNTNDANYEYSVGDVYGFDESGNTIKEINSHDIAVNGSVVEGTIDALKIYHIVLNRTAKAVSCNVGAGGIGTFEEGMYDDWLYYNSASGKGYGVFSQSTISESYAGDVSAKIEVNESHNWAVRMITGCDYPLVNNEKYSVGFWLKGDAGKKVKVTLQHHEGGTTVIEDKEIVIQNNEWKYYSTELTSNGDFEKGRVNFTFPEQGVYYLDNVEVNVLVPDVLQSVSPSHSEIRYSGVVHNEVRNEVATLYRFPENYATSDLNHTNPFVQMKTASRAAASSGISISFKTNSDNVLAHFHENTTILRF